MIRKPSCLIANPVGAVWRHLGRRRQARFNETANELVCSVNKTEAQISWQTDRYALGSKIGTILWRLRHMQVSRPRAPALLTLCPANRHEHSHPISSDVSGPPKILHGLDGQIGVRRGQCIQNLSSTHEVNAARTAALHAEEMKAHRTRLRVHGTDAMAGHLLGILRLGSRLSVNVWPWSCRLLLSLND